MAGILFFALAVISCPCPVALLCAVALHEAGHILIAAILGWGLPAVSFGAAGVRLSYHGAKKPLQSIAVSLGGSFTGVLFFLIPPLFLQFRLYSLGFALFNLLPVSCLDGGGALMALLESFMLPDRAFRISRAVSAVTVVLLWALSAAVQLRAGVNLTLLFVSVYLTVSTLSEGR